MTAGKACDELRAAVRFAGGEYVRAVDVLLAIPTTAERSDDWATAFAACSYWEARFMEHLAAWRVASGIGGRP